MNSFAAHIAPICGCATSMRRTLNAPTITFSTQKSSRVENTLQPKNRTPPSGTRFAATSTSALGESRRGGRFGRARSRSTTMSSGGDAAKGLPAPPGGRILRRERFDQTPGSGGDLRKPVQYVQVAHAGGVCPGAARGPGGDDPDGGPRGAPRRAATRPGDGCHGDDGARGGDARRDHRGGDPGVPSDVQRAAEGVLRPAAAGQPDREDRRAAGDGPWPRACPFRRPRAPSAVRESRGYGDSERGVRDEPA